MSIAISQCDIFRCLLLSGQQSKTESYLIYNDIKQRKAAIPYISEVQYLPLIKSKSKSILVAENGNTKVSTSSTSKLYFSAVLE